MNRENDLRERYIYAATRGLPRASRADIEQELRTLIDDLLEERCAGREPTEKDLRVVLTDLGTPAEIREKYNPRPARGLIGPDYYPQYKWALAVVLGALAFGVVLAQVLEVLTGERALGDLPLGLLGGASPRAWGAGLRRLRCCSSSLSGGASSSSARTTPSRTCRPCRSTASSSPGGRASSASRSAR